MFKITDHVITPDGKGTVMVIEAFSNSHMDGIPVPTGRYGVLHDEFPEHRPRVYKDDILYYFGKELVHAEDT